MQTKAALAIGPRGWDRRGFYCSDNRGEDSKTRFYAPLDTAGEFRLSLPQGLKPLTVDGCCRIRQRYLLLDKI